MYLWKVPTLSVAQESDLCFSTSCLMQEATYRQHTRHEIMPTNMGMREGRDNVIRWKLNSKNAPSVHQKNKLQNAMKYTILWLS